MSAFICHEDHIKALAIFAARPSRGYSGAKVRPEYVDGLEGLSTLEGAELAAAYANILMAENARSVMTRYSNEKHDDPEEITVTERDMRNEMLLLHGITIIKMCHCLDYQSCETEDWEQTPAYRLLVAIEKAAASEVPGYEDAPWAYSIPERKTARTAA